MYKPTRRTGVAAAVLATVGFTTVLATTASAFTERDEILIDRTGYDVAGDGFTNGVPDAPAIVEWSHSPTYGTFPTLVGKIHFDGVENCARVVLVSYDNDVEIGRTTSDEECPGTTDHYARNIELNGVGPLEGQIGADEVKVVLQTEASEDRWANAGSQRVAFGELLDTDPVQIKRAEFDLGGGIFSGGAPEGSATVEWRVEDNEEISANLVGTLYAKNADDACVLVQVRYKDADGGIIETRDGDEHCLTDDDLHEFPVNNGANFSDYALRQVTYALMKDGVQVGATTVELGDDFILIDPDLGPITP
jgi:hypothetical protein